VVNGFANTGITVNPTVEIRQAGIILQVVPRISPDGRVVMDVAAERSQYLPEDQGVTIYSDPRAAVRFVRHARIFPRLVPVSPYPMSRQSCSAA